MITPNSDLTPPRCPRGPVVRAMLRRYDGRLCRCYSVRFVGHYLRQPLRRRANVLPPVGISTSKSQRHVFDGGSTVHMVADRVIFYRCASPPRWRLLALLWVLSRHHPFHIVVIYIALGFSHAHEDMIATAPFMVSGEGFPPPSCLKLPTATKARGWHGCPRSQRLHLPPLSARCALDLWTGIPVRLFLPFIRIPSSTDVPCGFRYLVVLSLNTKRI